MTKKTLDWLNSNRYRAYPFVNDSGLIVHGSRIPDCVLLDCLVVDTRQSAQPKNLTVTKISVGDTDTKVTFVYGTEQFVHTITAGSSDDTNIIKIVGTSTGTSYVHMRMVYSSHEYILEHVGKGMWEFSGVVLPSKIVTSDASGVSCISVSGSSGVEGFSQGGEMSGTVHLTDGYRTQPVISNGRVLVKVGTKYGYDPCNYDQGSADTDSSEPAETSQCKDALLFFCGQNAINSGNISFEGGPGVNIVSGNLYTATKDIIDSRGAVGIATGESVPCIEVVASADLLRIYTPTDSAGSGSSQSPSESYGSSESSGS